MKNLTDSMKPATDWLMGSFPLETSFHFLSLLPAYDREIDLEAEASYKLFPEKIHYENMDKLFDRIFDDTQPGD